MRVLAGCGHSILCALAYFHHVIGQPLRLARVFDANLRGLTALARHAFDGILEVQPILG